MDKLLSVRECAERTGTSVEFWRKLIYRRQIPIVKVGRLTRIRESDLEAWLQTGAPISEKRGGTSMNKSALFDFIATLVQLLGRFLSAYWRM